MTGQGGKVVKERRSLVEGISPVDPTLEKKFVYSGKPTAADPGPNQIVSEPPATKHRPAAAVGRLPLSTRIRADFATALKRASLERQLSGVTPHTLQDILEEALEPWLRSNGYLD